MKALTLITFLTLLAFSASAQNHAKYVLCAPGEKIDSLHTQDTTWYGFTRPVRVVHVRVISYSMDTITVNARQFNLFAQTSPLGGASAWYNDSSTYRPSVTFPDRAATADTSGKIILKVCQGGGYYYADFYFGYPFFDGWFAFYSNPNLTATKRWWVFIHGLDTIN